MLKYTQGGVIMKKILFISLTLLMLLSGGMYEHVHDDQCGYNPDTESGCIYENKIDTFEFGGPFI